MGYSVKDYHDLMLFAKSEHLMNEPVEKVIPLYEKFLKELFEDMEADTALMLQSEEDFL